MTYDANGNLLNDGTKTYTWNARNQLVSISGNVTATFSYDAVGRRISKTINGTRTDYQYDGNDIVSEIGGSVVNATYVRSLNIDEPFARITSSSQEFYHADALGSVFSLTDANGSSTASYTYDSFGNTSQTGISSNPFQFTGRESDNGTGLYYYRARYYSSILQRFISEDPIGLRGGDLNFYNYVQLNPVNQTDPLGLMVKFPVIDPGVGGKCTNCNKANPLPSNSTKCDNYGDQKYRGAGLKCFCKCAGDSAWSQQVRGCLACEFEKGTDMSEAHSSCYAAAGGYTKSPIATLGVCYYKCLGK